MPPCRLFVIVARAAPRAVVFRRGPSEWYQVIAWDTARDVFSDGAWFKGRIYENRCDLSPDGRLLAAACGGAAVAAVPGALRARFGASEVIVTITSKTPGDQPPVFACWASTWPTALCVR